MSGSGSATGGSASIRGYLVQTLVALLDIAQANPPFLEITLEPQHANDQFDFVWRDDNGTYAVQVKSTINTFKKAEVEQWASKLESVRSTEHCRLILVGNYETKLEKFKKVGLVELEKKNLDLPGLFDQAAHRIAKFIHAEQLDACTPDKHEMIAKALVTQLEQYSTTREPLSREAFLSLLRGWIRNSPRQNLVNEFNGFDRYKPENLLGREDELARLDQAWNPKSPLAPLLQRGEPSQATQQPHILTFVAMGGEGKTSLVAYWASRLVNDPANGCEAAFAWSFYSQGAREQSNASADLFLHDALEFFGDADMANSPRPAAEKGKRLAALVAERRTLLVLDGLEPLQYPPTAKGLEKGKLKDPGLSALLRGLAQRNPGLCLVTTRLSIADLNNHRQTAPEIELPRLSKAAGVELLAKLGVHGSAKERGQLVEDVYGHALTLNLLGSYLREAHAGDIRRRDRVKLAEADAEEQNGHAFHVMDAYVRWFEGSSSAQPDNREDASKANGTDLNRHPGMDRRGPDDRDVNQPERRTGEDDKGPRALALLRLLGLFDRPASADCLAALRQAPAILGLTEPLVGLGEAPLNLVLSRLAETKLLTVNRDGAGGLLSLDAHPLLREYFAEKLKTEAPQAWRSAHERLFRHLCETTQDQAEPSLDELQPLYQAVAHGCAAGLQQEAFDEVYQPRIMRYDEAYSIAILGAYSTERGACACFFDEIWHLPSPELRGLTQILLFNNTAHVLRGLGRLAEALEPLQAGLRMSIEWDEPLPAAYCSYNLSELKLALGKITEAIEQAESSMTYANLCGDEDRETLSHTGLANVRHQAGQKDKAAIMFQAAENLHVERQPAYPLLYSMPGFQYCDLLLAIAEREAWQALLSTGSTDHVEKESTKGHRHFGKDAETQAKDGISPIKQVFEPKQSADSRIHVPELDSGNPCRNDGGLALAACRTASKRAEQTIQWEQGRHLDIALDHLTLARADLYATCLTPPAKIPPEVSANTETAVAGFHQAGAQEFLVLGLLTRAWLRRLEGLLTGPGSAQEDLDEAYEIAERGPMPLFLADIHLHRARLFGTLSPGTCPYPWQSPAADLNEARRLIGQHGYWRRKEELEDAELALCGSAF